MITDPTERLKEAIRLTVENGAGQTSLLQRKMLLGYNEAERLMDKMEALGIIAPRVGGHPRTLLQHDLDEALKLVKEKAPTESLSKGTITMELTKEQQDLLNLGVVIQSGETKWYFFPYWMEVGAKGTKLHNLENLPQELKMLLEKNRESVEKIFGSKISDSNLGEIDEGVG